MTKEKSKLNIKIILILQLAVCIYTISGITQKKAANYDIFSYQFVLFLGLTVLILGVYAIVWQQIISRIDLSIAYANRAFAIFWSAIWAAFIFHEQITFQNILGIVIIFVGILIVNSEKNGGDAE